MTADPLSGRSVFITGASRGIGLAIALACAARGAKVAITGKTEEPHPKLPGTIHTAAEEVRAAGAADAVAVVMDVRDGESVKAAVDKTAEKFGGIDILVNNASAIQLTGTAETELKRFDLMMSVNARGSYTAMHMCLPYLLKSDHARVLTLSPPLDFAPVWWKGHPAYSLAKYGMSVLTHAWAAEFEGKIAANGLWPRTTIDTAAVRNLLGGDAMASRSRTPEIMGDAAAAILAKPVDFTGWFCLDDLVLTAEGVTDFSKYAVTPGEKLQPDFFVPMNAPMPEAANGMVGWRAPML